MGEWNPERQVRAIDQGGGLAGALGKTEDAMVAVVRGADRLEMGDAGKWIVP
jgi:hypothetical protein